MPTSRKSADEESTGSLQGKIALITGAASGMGLAGVHLFAKALAAGQTPPPVFT